MSTKDGAVGVANGAEPGAPPIAAAAPVCSTVGVSVPAMLLALNPGPAAGVAVPDGAPAGVVGPPAGGAAGGTGFVPGCTGGVPGCPVV